MPMKTSIDLDAELQAEVERALDLIREKPATVIRLAIRAGLPIIADRFQPARPEGYFADAYKNIPKERIELEAAFGNTKIFPDLFQF
jgi:Arc/MetJ family transcription regulator